jgi:tetratricopeptide (TPR) repeat protein
VRFLVAQMRYLVHEVLCPTERLLFLLVAAQESWITSVRRWRNLSAESIGGPGVSFLGKPIYSIAGRKGTSSMSFANGSLQPNPLTAQPATSPKRRGLQFVVAVAGAALCLWLSQRMPIDTHHLPPDFAGRFQRIAPSLAVYLAGMFCFFWALALYKGWERRIEARKAMEEGKRASAQPGVSKQTRTVLVAGYFAVWTVLMGFRYINILWPTHSWAIERYSVFVFVGTVVAGMLLQHKGQKVQFARRADDFGRKQEPIAISTPKIIAATLVLLAAGGWAIFKIAQFAAPGQRNQLVGTVAVLLTAAFGFVMHLVQKGKQEPDANDEQASIAGAEAVNISKRKVRAAVALVILESLFIAFMTLPIRPAFKSAAFYGQFVVLIGGAVVVSLIKRKVYFLSKSGQFDRALRLNRMMLKVPGYGNSFEGVILFNAGRYSEARASLKPLAFDSNGKPKLASTDLYCYALASENDGHVQEAEELLRAALDTSPNEGTHKDALKVALATCLLDQEKEAARACSLLEQAMATPRESGSSYGSRADDAHRVARYAWALASAGRRADAERTIQQAIDLSKGLKDYDVAGTQYFTGEAWRMLGKTDKARDAFQQALALSPQGVIALSVKKAQAKLGNSQRVWAN